MLAYRIRTLSTAVIVASASFIDQIVFTKLASIQSSVVRKCFHMVLNQITLKQNRCMKHCYAACSHIDSTRTLECLKIFFSLHILVRHLIMRSNNENLNLKIYSYARTHRCLTYLRHSGTLMIKWVRLCPNIDVIRT